MMNAIERILWPTDFSDEGRRALPAVNVFARLFAARVEVLHVVPSAPAMASVVGNAAPAMTEYVQSMSEHAQKTIGSIVEEDIETGIPVGSTVTMGSAAHEIANFAADNDIDLIILSTNGETGLTRLIVGSVAEKVVRLAPCPVLTVPPESEDD
jgi:nucleotide-binding universal stress UspA family protein